MQALSSTYATRPRAVPLSARPPRKPRAAAEEVDPYPWGWRWLADGTGVGQPIPLTREDLLDPQEGDQVAQDSLHRQLVAILTDMLERRYGKGSSLTVLSDLKVRFKVPKLRGPAPDICLVAHLRDRARRRGSLEEEAEGAKIRLMIEIPSENYKAKDYVENKEIYDQAGMEEYVTIEPLGFYLNGSYKLGGYHRDEAGDFKPMELVEGRLYSQVLDLWISPDPTGWGLRLEDGTTGERLRTSKELKADLERAEKRAMEEVELRQSAEKRAAELEAELNRLRSQLGDD